MQGEGAATYSHDLARERQADAASFLLRGEEWDKDMGSDVVGDDAGIVGYVNDYRFLVVGVSFDSDESMLIF